MPTPTRVNQIDQGLDRLLEQFKNKPNIKGHLSAYLKQTNDVEISIFDIIGSRGLEDSFGVQLDQLGNIVGQPRNGMSDDDYRIQIKFKIAVNNSEGTPEDLITMLYDATNSSEVRYFEHYPSSYMISYDGNNTPSDLLNYMQSASPVCVNLGVMHDENNTGWIPSEIGSTGESYDRGVLPETTDILGYLPVEIYTDGLGGSSGLSSFDLSTCYNSQLFTGTGGEIDIDVGFDISDGKSISFIKCISGDSCWEELVSPMLGVNKFRRMGQMTSSTRNLGVTNYTNTGFTIDQDVLLPSVDRFNNSLDVMSVNTFRQKEGFCDIISYTGDGSLIRKLSHSVGKPVSSMLIFPKVNTGTVQHEMYWFKGMSGEQYISNGALTENVSVWASQLPTDKDITVGFDSGVINPNEVGIEYIALIFADNPDIGITSIEYQSTDELADKIDLPFNLGYCWIRGASQSSLASFDYKSTPSRSRVWAGSALGVANNLIYSLDSDGFRLGSSPIVNSSSGTGRYFCLAIKNPEGVPTRPPKVNPDIKSIFSVDIYQGNGSNTKIGNGLDLLNDDGLLFNWRTNSISYVNHYNPIYDSSAISQLGAIGYKSWLSSNSGFNSLNNLDYLSDGFSMDSTSDWNVNGLEYLSMCIKQSQGFLEIVPFTGDGRARQEVPHTLGKQVSLLIICEVGTGQPVANMWMKGMPEDEVLTYSTTLTAGAIWGGSIPTDSVFSVGDIGSSIFNMNEDGVEYVAYVFADDIQSGISCGSYVATGLGDQEVDIENRVGMLMIRNSNNGLGCINTYKTGTVSKPMNSSAPINGLISGIDINDTKVVLSPQNSFTNDVGKTHYWFNIANPTT